ncbi:MAG TPA: glycogen synthase GlgA [Candidatus Polarisedimenticolia bacterium]|jgi:starch synthase|nr:glycogen synthase GlgA [Candidatus Polarisedimenticolia bacterium]
MPPIEIWQAASEARPLAQTGGLGDVLRALPAAQARLGHRVRRLLPAYGGVDRAGFVPEPPALSVPLGTDAVPVRFLSRLGEDGVVTTLVECDELFGRRELYGPPGAEFPDNPRRFTLLARAIVEWAGRVARPPDVLHVHDWHVALAPLFVRFAPPPSRSLRTVLTIHNLGYQGKYPAAEMQWLSLGRDLEARLFHPEGIEFYGGINFLKAGILFADRITTVSPNYAREILTPEFGCGLEGVLAGRRDHLTGILNGADYDLWNPETDAALPRRYGADSLEGRAADPSGKEEARQALRREFGLRPAKRPLLGVVSRLAHQKGIDLLAEAAPALWKEGADLAVLGTGDPDLVDRLRRLKEEQPHRLGLKIQYDDRCAHLVVAGSDFVLVPSRYEPCGLVQMHALRYGTPPIVTRTGGLADTVKDETESPGAGTGFIMRDPSAEALVEASGRGMTLRQKRPAAWRELQRRAMAEEFSWEMAARRYIELYQEPAESAEARRTPEPERPSVSLAE